MSKAVESTAWEIAFAPEAAGEKVITLATTNKFVDKDIEITVTTAQGALGAGSGSAEASSDISGLLGTASSTQPASGHYIKVEADANVAVATSGWIDDTEDVDVSIADVYYPITEGAQTITGGGLSEGAKSSAIASDGSYDGTSYDTSDKVKFESAEAAGVYKIHANGSATVNRAAVTKQVTQDGYFAADAEAQTAVSADSLTVTNPDAPYYIKKSTLSTNSVTPSTVAQTVTIGEGYYPSDRTVTVAAMAPGAASSSFDNSGLSTYFNAGTSSDNDVSITPQYSIDTAGYLAATANPVDGTPSYYTIKTTSVTEGTTTVSGTTATRGTASWGTGWITADNMGAATFANTATNGTTYVDISGTTDAPVLISGDYLYINKGYTDDLKISLAKLVPDGSDVKGHSEYILTGHSAYDDDGTLVAGTMPVWDGTYSIA